MKDREWEQGQNDHKGGKDFSMVTIPINILDQKESRDTVQLPLGLFPFCVWGEVGGRERGRKAMKGIVRG